MIDFFVGFLIYSFGGIKVILTMVEREYTTDITGQNCNKHCSILVNIIAFPNRLWLYFRKAILFCKCTIKLAITCSKWTIETLEKDVCMFKVNNKDTRAAPLMLYWCLFCELWAYLISSSSVSIANFEQVNVSWANYCFKPSSSRIFCVYEYLCKSIVS